MELVSLFNASESSLFGWNWSSVLKTSNSNVSKQIRRLHLIDNKMIGDEGLGFLTDVVHQIEELLLQGCSITGSGIKTLSEKLLETQHKVNVYYISFFSKGSCYWLSWKTNLPNV